MPESENGPTSLKIYCHAERADSSSSSEPTPSNNKRPGSAGSSRQYRLEQIRRERSEPPAQASAHRDGRRAPNPRSIVGWLGKRSAPMEPTILENAVQEIPSYKIYPPSARRGDPAHEPWTLNELLERWITRSDGELIISRRLVSTEQHGRYQSRSRIRKHLLDDLHGIYYFCGGLRRPAYSLRGDRRLGRSPVAGSQATKVRPLEHHRSVEPHKPHSSA